MIAIYEPLYLPDQELTEPAFLPLRLPDNARAEWREFRILIAMYRRALHRNQALTGLLSPKFGKKTGITGSRFIAFIEANPGADVYMINPYPQMAYMNFNVWTHGAFAHAGLLPAAQALLNAAGIGWNLAEVPRHGPDAICFSNFWVGSERFWDDYVGGVLNPIAEFLEAHPESDAARAVMGSTRYFPFSPAPYLPFIIERLFSTYLSLERPSVRPYLLDPVESCKNDFEKDIVAFLLGRVRQADRDGTFPPELRQWMHLLIRLRRRFSAAHYLDRPHPDTGTAITPADAEASARALAGDKDFEPLR